MLLLHSEKQQDLNTVIHIIVPDQSLDKLGFTKDEIGFVERMREEEDLVHLTKVDKNIFLYYIDPDWDRFHRLEMLRKAGFRLSKTINRIKIEELELVNHTNDLESGLAMAEGMALSNYQFLKYFSDKEKRKNHLKKISLVDSKLRPEELEVLSAVIKSVYKARDLVNEPVSYLTASRLAEEIESMGKEAGFSTEVFHKKKIESLRMGGLLAVNKGSIDPPTFTIMEWKPLNPVNTKPYVLVGKGVVYDTGGLSLKPTRNSMDYMKSDMSGAAAVAGAMHALASTNIPIHIIALVPATDNRPDGNAYTPGDVITMYNGKTVEVLNTDAEGRMILADALSYASSYDPELIIEFSTLTGSAVAAVGHLGMVGMTNVPEEQFNELKEAGNKVFERIAEFPFWDEYSEMLKSNIADLKNIGGRQAGAITAGKFLEHFTDHPFIHLDIAGCAFIEKEKSYQGQGGTGVGVRLVYEYFRNIASGGK